MTMKPIVYTGTKNAVNILFEGTLGKGGQAKMDHAANYSVRDGSSLVELTVTANFEPATRIATLASTPDLPPVVFVRVGDAITGDADTPFEQVSTIAAPNPPEAMTISGPVNVQIGPSDLVEDARQALRTQRDAFSYPMLTEDIATSTRTQGSGRNRGGSSALATLVNQTLVDVLGWKARADDPAAFQGALTASFELDEVDGVSNWKWTPRTYAVQSDLSGGITGAQASLYKRAQEALDQSLPLLDGLYALDPKADTENIAALKAVVRTQFTQLVSELAAPGGPSEARVNSYFDLLLTRNGVFRSGSGTLATSEPNDLGGTLGELRDQLGLGASQNFVNTIEDEQDLTNFRILADYVTGLAQTWLNNRQFFGFGKGTRFLGTQLVPLSRQLTVVSEAVDEVRFALDSVFIGAAERQTLPLTFGRPEDGMYAEDFLQWIQNFVDDEAPVYVQQGGKFGIGNSLLPIARRLHGMASKMKDQPGLPRGFYTSRVERTLDSLVKEIGQLESLAAPVGIDFTSPVPAPILLVVPRSVDIDIGLTDSAQRVSLLNPGTADLVVDGAIDKAGSTAFVFTFRNNQNATGLQLTIKAGSSRDVVIDGTKGINGAKLGDSGAAVFSYARADGSGEVHETSVKLEIVESHTGSAARGARSSRTGP